MSYIVHKAVEVTKLRKSSHLAKMLGINPNYMARRFWPQRKYDGCNLVVVWDGTTVEKWSRTGEVVKSMDHLDDEIRRFLVPGVYLGEAWLAGEELQRISGIFRRQTVKAGEPMLQFVMFDMLSLEEWRHGATSRPFSQRWWHLARTTAAYDGGAFLRGSAWLRTAETTPRVDAARTQVMMEELALQLQGAGGYDGLILRDPEGIWTKGDEGRNGEIIKIKPRMRVSCRVVGWESGKGKHEGRIGTLVVSYKGRHQGAGTGLKDSERDPEEFGLNWYMKVVEIEALGETPDGYLREPVLKGLRDDVLGVD